MKHNLHYLWRVILAALISLALYTDRVIADWASPYYADHPLVGKIYAPAKQDWASRAEVEQALNSSDYLLLGETHSNPDHHIGQARLITEYLRVKSKAVIVFEMLEVSSWRRSGEVWDELDSLLAKVKELAPRWGWDIYQPILKVAIDRQLPIYASNLNREELAKFHKSAQCSHTRGGKTLEFCDTINSLQHAAVKDLIFDAHCGYVPREQLDALVNMQIARDASFALSMLNAHEIAAPVLITGAVHARKDIGVPVHLRANGVKSLSIVFLSVDPNRKSPHEYFEADLGLQYDYIYFTPSERNTDPCVEFAEQLKKIKTHQ